MKRSKPKSKRTFKIKPPPHAPLSSPVIVGRESESVKIRACLKASRNVLLEGPVGVGKTHLALSVIAGINAQSFRIDGDSRYSEQKLSGWFDPPLALKYGFNAKSFVAGPLVEAMRSGGVLFINELNRLPEGVQNILLPAIDEQMITVPRLGRIDAKAGFKVVATQNPKEFVATTHLSEAILDRFELVVLNYQSELDETKIVLGKFSKEQHSPGLKRLVSASVLLVRITRDHPRFRRGASVRAAIAISEIAVVMMTDGLTLRDAFSEAVLIALPTRVELQKDTETDLGHHEVMEALFMELVQEVFDTLDSQNPEKKK